MSKKIIICQIFVFLKKRKGYLPSIKKLSFHLCRQLACNLLQIASFEAALCFHYVSRLFFHVRKNLCMYIELSINTSSSDKILFQRSNSTGQLWLDTTITGWTKHYWLRCLMFKHRLIVRKYRVHLAVVTWVSMNTSVRRPVTSSGWGSTFILGKSNRNFLKYVCESKYVGLKSTLDHVFWK